MSRHYRVLIARIERDSSDLDRTAEAIGRHWQRASSETSDLDAFLNSVALNLHGWYSGLERIFEAIAVEFDGGLPHGDAWHADLLRQMALDLSPSRPPVLTPEVSAKLDAYRKFRHLIRNIYATNLSAERMEILVLELPSVWQQAREQLAAFGAFVTDLIPPAVE